MLHEIIVQESCKIFFFILLKNHSNFKLCSLCTETTTGCFIGSGKLGSRKETSKITGEKAALDMLYSTSIGACVDHHVQDQLIVFMALAKGTSKIRTPPLTLHTKTAIYVCELMTKVGGGIL